jgi:hypothetical protein
MIMFILNGVKFMQCLKALYFGLSFSSDNLQSNIKTLYCHLSVVVSEHATAARIAGSNTVEETHF